MKRFAFTPAAEDDIQQISNYLRALPKTPALRIGSEIQKAIETVTARPHLGRLDTRLSERSGAKVLRSLCGSYVLFYFATDAGISILGILHGKRDIQSIMEKRLG